MRKLLVLNMVTALVIGITSNCLAAGYVNTNLIGFIGHDSDWSNLNGITAEVAPDTGYGLSMAIGNDLPEYRFELEVAYRLADLEEISVPALPTLPAQGEISSAAIMANYYKDFDTPNALAPFIGFGFGIANIDFEVDDIIGVAVNESGDDTVFAYQIALGAIYKINEKLIAELSYRYFATDNPDINDTEIEYATSNVMLGLRMYF